MHANATKVKRDQACPVPHHLLELLSLFLPLALTYFFFPSEKYNPRFKYEFRREKAEKAA